MNINKQLNLNTPSGFAGMLSGTFYEEKTEESKKITSYEFEKDLKEWREMGLITEESYQRAYYEIFICGREVVRMNDRLLNITDSEERCEKEKKKLVKVAKELSIT